MLVRCLFIYKTQHHHSKQTPATASQAVFFFFWKNNKSVKHLVCLGTFLFLYSGWQHLAPRNFSRQFVGSGYISRLVPSYPKIDFPHMMACVRGRDLARLREE